MDWEKYLVDTYRKECEVTEPAKKPGPPGPPGSPLAVLTAMPAPLVADVLAGDLAACEALDAWLADAAHIDRWSDRPERQHQRTQFRRLVRTLFMRAVDILECEDDPRAPAWADRRRANCWRVFREEVRQLFAFDLYGSPAVFGLVGEVVRPGRHTHLEA